jgi:zinc protease
MIHETRLENGVILLTRRSEHNDIVAIRATFLCGSRSDPPGQSGVTSLMFSLMLKDTEKRSAAEVAEYLEEVGGSIGEEARKDVASISATCTSKGLPVAVEVIGDAIRRPAFLPQKVDLEKNNLLMSIREEEDSPLAATFKLLHRHLYNGHPYARPVRGEPETVASLSRDHVAEHHFRMLSPDRLVIACVGSFDEEGLIHLWEDALAGWELRETPGEGRATLDSPSENRSATRIRAGEAVWTVMGYLAPPVAHPDHVSLKVLDCILGSSVDSRLFCEVRDRRALAYIVGTSYLERMEEGVFAAYWGTSPERQDAAFEAVLREVVKAREEPPAADEVERARKYLRGIFIIAQETNAGQAALFGMFESIGLGYKYVDQYVEHLEKVSPEDVQRVAQRYLNHYVLAVTTPVAASKGLLPQTGSGIQR